MEKILAHAQQLVYTLMSLMPSLKHCFGQGTLLGVYRWLVLSVIAYILAHWAYLSIPTDDLPHWKRHKWLLKLACHNS
jgi:hypothetical protein